MKISLCHRFVTNPLFFSLDPLFTNENELKIEALSLPYESRFNYYCIYSFELIHIESLKKDAQIYLNIPTLLLNRIVLGFCFPGIILAYGFKDFKILYTKSNTLQMFSLVDFYFLKPF